MQTAPAEEPSEGAEQQPKRRGHARKSDDSGGAEEDAAAQKEFQPNQRARKRRSDVSLVSEESSAKDKSQPKESGRPSLPNVSVAGVTPSRESKANSSSTVAKRTTKAAAGKHGAAEAAQSAAERRRSKGARRQEHDQLVAEMDDDLEASLPPVPKYQHIEQRTRHIPKSTISAKWQPLDDSSVKAITTLISDTSRPVLLRLRDTELRRQQGQNILRIFSNRLRSKLHKGMPFPPPTSKGAGVKSNKADLASGHVEELNFETTVDSIESMETMLDPLLHSVALLEKEKAKEEAALEREYETLRTLEANAKSEARGWKERMKKAHALAPEVRRHDDVLGVDGAAGEGLALVKHKSLSLNGVFNVSHELNDAFANDVLIIAIRTPGMRGCCPCPRILRSTWRAYREICNRYKKYSQPWGKAGRRCRAYCRDILRQSSSRRYFLGESIVFQGTNTTLES